MKRPRTWRNSPVMVHPRRARPLAALQQATVPFVLSAAPLKLISFMRMVPGESAETGKLTQ